MQACPRCRATYPDDVSTCPEDGASLLPSGMLAPVDAPLSPGTMVGEYRVDSKLGAGTFGDVYAGEQPIIGKRVAIKLLHRKLSSDAEVVSRFVAEARAVNRIRHRHIIDIFSFGMLGDHRHYFVMELLDGLTLGELLERERRLPLDVALPVFRGIASALDAAHEAGITHRDLKPDNVFLAVEKDGSYFPKLLDFGIAKLAGEDVAHRTATGMAIGTPRYMSPEQCRGKKVDHKADIYSLGAVIHEVLTGKPLFEGDGTMDLFFKHASEMPAPMSEVCPDLPPELDAPVLAMLAKKPKDRPESAGAAVRDLVERARAAGQAATLPASSQSARHVVRPASEDHTVERLPPDAATVAVRQRATPASDPGAPRTLAAGDDEVPTTPDATGLAASGSPSKDVPTVARTSAAGISADVSSLEDGGGQRRSTEIAPASRVSGTLLSAGPEPEAVASPPGPTMRSPAAADTEPLVPKPGPAPDRRPRPIPWVAIVVAAIVLAGGGLAVQRALAPSSGGATADTSGASGSSAPASPPSASSTASASAASSTASASGMEAPAPGVEAPASSSAAGTASAKAPAPASAQAPARPPAAGAARGKPLAIPDAHKDLETPPEIGPNKR